MLVQLVWLVAPPHCPALYSYCTQSSIDMSSPPAHTRSPAHSDAAAPSSHAHPPARGRGHAAAWSAHLPQRHPAHPPARRCAAHRLARAALCGAAPASRPRGAPGSAWAAPRYAWAATPCCTPWRVHQLRARCCATRWQRAAGIGRAQRSAQLDRRATREVFLAHGLHQG